MPDFLLRPWPWYVAGPLIGLFVPALLLLGNKPFGISSNLRHMCAAIAPANFEFFRYDWKRAGGWNLAFVAGVLAGGFVAARVLGTPTWRLLRTRGPRSRRSASGSSPAWSLATCSTGSTS